MKTKTRTEREEKDQYWLYAKETVLSALRIITIFAVVAQVIFMFEDWFTSPENFVSLFTAKMVSITVLIGAYLISSTQWGKKYLDLSVMLVAIAIIANISFQASLIGATFMTPLVAILITFISASLFPWKLRYHILATIICITGVVLNMMAMQEPPYVPLTREAMSGVVFPAVTILLAVFVPSPPFRSVAS